MSNLQRRILKYIIKETRIHGDVFINLTKKFDNVPCGQSAAKELGEQGYIRYDADAGGFQAKLNNKTFAYFETQARERIRTIFIVAGWSITATAAIIVAVTSIVGLCK